MSPEWIIAACSIAGLALVAVGVGAVVFYAGQLDQIVKDLVRRVTAIENEQREFRLGEMRRA